MITNDTVLSFLNCARKAYLKAAGAPGDPTDIEKAGTSLDKVYVEDGLRRYLAGYMECDVVRDPPSLEAAIAARPQIIVHATAVREKVCSHITLAERVGQVGKRGASIYAPVLFVRNEKISSSDRLLLAFQAFALASVQEASPTVARLVHGLEYKVLRLRVDLLIETVRDLIGKIESVTSVNTPPTLTLNRHCSACEFQKACQKAAEETDDLSLLRGMSEKEIEKQRRRGVITVTQFSHTYRPGRRGKRRTDKARKHDHALQALAVREKKVYVLDSPTVPRSAVSLYLDVEGVPDQGFDYLIGLVAVRDGVCTPYSFWADDKGQVKAMWDACARVISSFEDYTLYHYGQYELRFLDRMQQLASPEEAAVIERIRGRSCNVLGVIYSRIYFPTWSNRLKDIGPLLGAKWSAVNASGIQSMAWRLAWEASQEESLKQELLLYNREDCLALRRVTEFIRSLCGGASVAGEGPEVAAGKDIPQPGGYCFGKTEFFCPELAAINRRAYADYQRDKVYLRTCPAMRESLARKKRAGRKRLRVNEEVECGRPAACPECGACQIHTFRRQPYIKVVSDLKFTPSGVKRWLIRYSSLRYRCWDCKKTFLADGYRAATWRSGNNLCAWAIYHHVALRQSYEDVNLSLNDIFGFSFIRPVLTRIKPWMAGRHQGAYDRLKDKLRRGPLIHADETKVLVKGHSGYVWTFTNMEEVIYVYTPTREGAILDDVLDGFNGVLVSDFYAAYDAAKCPQQKCLIHLIRDVNDDVFHNPFDEELKQLAQRMVAILKPIIDTVDRYGLKQHHLHKHKEDVARYFRSLSTQSFGSEFARKYQKRMQKYQDKLFVFLDHDNIPWNNNNAENAIKRFASRRRIIGVSLTEKGIQDYLLFLSIYQTCKHKHLSFLRFLRSGKSDLDEFASGKT